MATSDLPLSASGTLQIHVKRKDTAACLSGEREREDSFLSKTSQSGKGHGPVEGSNQPKSHVYPKPNSNNGARFPENLAMRSEKQDWDKLRKRRHAVLRNLLRYH